MQPPAMELLIELETERLKLRQWEKEDWPLFAASNSDAVTMEYFPNLLSEAESYAIADKIQSLIELQGWGFWAVEEKDSGMFIGFVGLNSVLPTLPFYPSVEIGWHLSRASWGRGYATEAAKAALEVAFNKLGFTEICSFTSVANARSIAVMRRLNMHNMHQNFEHPVLPEGSPLREHVLYKISKQQWKGDIAAA